jgi:G8 domain
LHLSSRRRAAALVAASLLCGLVVTTTPAEAAPTAVARKVTGVQLWSDPKTWGGTVPPRGAEVRIPSGSSVKLNVSPPALGGLQVDGTLSFAEKNLALTSDWIVVHGTFRVGKQADPFEHRAVITLSGDDRSVDVMGMGTSVLGVMGGKLDMHGRDVVSWTGLDTTAEPGDSEIVLQEASSWKPGDRIVLASTDYWSSHDEERTVTWVSDRTVELDRPLEYQHWGTVQSYGEHSVDERAEVGLLTRNIVVRGDADSPTDGFGGHMMIMSGGRARIEGVEFANMGQSKQLRRYPVHFHMDGSAPDSYLKESAIHHSFNRCVTVHGTNELTIKDNVCFDHLGHGFFMEDGAERRNVFAGNLGLGTREVDDGLLPTDENPATFWITNPDNTFRNNVAAGSDGFGFWYALPEHPTGLSHGNELWPRRTPLREFSGNVAHSNGSRGLNVDDGPDESGHVTSTWYNPLTDPADPNSAPVVARFEGFTAYMNRDRGVWLRGENHVVTGATLADNRAGATFASEETFLEDSFVVGETANIGTTESWEDAGFNGRALPFYWEPDAQVVGFEFYDGRVGVTNTTFAGFESNPVRGAGALGYLDEDAFSVHPKNFAENLDFIDSNRVYMADPKPGLDGDMSKVFVDRDGSVTGAAGSTVVVNNPFLLNNTCSFNTAWNSHVCVSDYASLWIGASSTQAVQPVVLGRGDGVKQTLMGCCDDSKEAITSVIPGRSYSVDFNGSTPSEARFVLWRGRGKWIQLSLDVDPTFSVTRWGQNLASVTSLNALGQRTESGYFYDLASTTLHLKIVASNTDWEEIRVQS